MEHPVHVRRFHGLLNGLRHSLSHIVITLVAITIAFSIPIIAKYVLFDWWPAVQADGNLLLATEVGLSAILILFFNVLKIVWDSRRMLAAARSASLVYAIDPDAPRSREHAKRLVRRSSVTRDAFVLAVTGFDTFVAKHSLFQDVLPAAYEIRAMLLNPSCDAAIRCVDAIPDAGVNLQSLREEIEASIAYLTSLYKVGKKVTLKFYDHEPVWKVVVLGDQVWVQHYHHGFEVKQQPDYAFALQSSAPRKGFFVPFYTYFLDHWNEPHHPEYNFETRELIYRDRSGNESRRIPLHARPELENVPA